jgi:putative peptidoglycan lipid II flippase
LQQLPLGLFGVAVATVTLPMLSRLATDGMTPAFRTTLAKGLRLVLFLTLPCAIGLALLAKETVSVIFEHGRFTAHDTAMTAGPLQAYAFGLVFYAAVKVLQPAFFTIDRRFVPLVITFITITLNAVLNSISVFVMKWDHTALAWCTAFNLAVNFTVLYWWMGKFAHGLETRVLVASLGRLAIALTAMAGVCLAAQFTILADWENLRLWARLAGLAGTIGVAAVTYFFLTAKLGVEETGEFLALISKRFGGRG